MHKRNISHYLPAAYSIGHYCVVITILASYTSDLGSAVWYGTLAVRSCHKWRSIPAIMDLEAAASL